MSWDAQKWEVFTSRASKTRKLPQECEYFCYIHFNKATCDWLISFRWQKLFPQACTEDFVLVFWKYYPESYSFLAAKSQNTERNIDCMLVRNVISLNRFKPAVLCFTSATCGVIYLAEATVLTLSIKFSSTHLPLASISVVEVMDRVYFPV